MCSLRSTLRATTLANRKGLYIVVLILTGHAKSDLGKKLQESLRLQQRFVDLCVILWEGFVQLYYPDINKKVTAKLPIMCEPNEELNVLN